VGTKEGDALRSRLESNVRLLVESLTPAPRPVPDAVSPIFPLIIGDEQQTLRLATILSAAGFFSPAIRYPTVARGSARLRIALSSSHSGEQIKSLSKFINESQECSR
jgi:7-keto-8-aminopelargonate synthetase-like enzyme